MVRACGKRAKICKVGVKLREGQSRRMGERERDHVDRWAAGSACVSPLSLFLSLRLFSRSSRGRLRQPLFSLGSRLSEREGGVEQQPQVYLKLGLRLDPSLSPPGYEHIFLPLKNTLKHMNIWCDVWTCLLLPLSLSYSLIREEGIEEKREKEVKKKIPTGGKKMAFDVHFAHSHLQLVINFHSENFVPSIFWSHFLAKNIMLKARDAKRSKKWKRKSWETNSQNSSILEFWPLFTGQQLVKKHVWIFL